MSRHSSSTTTNANRYVRTDKEKGGTKITTNKHEIYKMEEETRFNKRHYEEYASSARSISTYGHGSEHGPRALDKHKSENGSGGTRDKHNSVDKHVREPSRYEKRPKYPDNHDRVLSHLHHVDELSDRLVHGTGRHGTRKNHVNEASRKIKDFELVFEQKVYHGR